MKTKRNSDNLLLVVAIVALVVSVVGVGISYNSLTGFAITYGELNVTISDYASINFTTSKIDFGAGSVSSDDPAILFTNGTATIGGTWTSPSTGFVVENIGNVNVSLRINTEKDSGELVGGTGDSYQYLIVDDEVGSCHDLVPSVYTDVNKTGTGTLVCSSFRPEPTMDQISIDVKLVIPPDAEHTGAVGDFFMTTIAAV